MRRCPGSATGTRFCSIRFCGISISAGLTPSGWSRDASASISTAFITNSPPDPKKIDEATRRHYAALYARPHAMHDAFEQFGAFTQDAVDNKALLAAGRLAMPVLAVGAEKSFGTTQADNIRAVADNVTVGIVPGSGHW